MDAYLRYEKHGEPPHELTPAEISGVVQLFAQAAVRAQKAGFDGVEIHGAHGYLIGQFHSAAKNKRKDAYGGELKNRARFLLEVIAAVREAVGADYSVWCRLSAEETGLKRGITFEETKEERRVTQWCQTASDIADQKDEEDDNMRLVFSFPVRPEQGTDKNHGSARSSNEAGQHSANGQADSVNQRCSG